VQEARTHYFVLWAWDNMPTFTKTTKLNLPDVEVEAIPYNRDILRSEDLVVVSGPVEYHGYDDGGTSDDESDDNHLYYLRWYSLRSHRNASRGEIWVYDPDLERVHSWKVLECVVHKGCKGLTAKPNGEIHGVIIPVPVRLMEKASTYRFVLHFYDDYADTYKNHQVKAALEVNQTTEGERLDIWISTLSDINFRYKIHWNWISDAFSTIAQIPTEVHKCDTEGEEETVFGGIRKPIFIKFKSLSKAQKGEACRRTVIVMGHSSTLGKDPGLTIDRKLSPEKPALSVVFTEIVRSHYPGVVYPETESELKNGYTNVLIHELTHVANDYDKILFGLIERHCSDNVSTCIWRSEINSNFYDSQWHNRIKYTYKGERYEYPSPWHSLDEINEMRKSMKLPLLQP